MLVHRLISSLFSLLWNEGGRMDASRASLLNGHQMDAAVRLFDQSRQDFLKPSGSEGTLHEGDISLRTPLFLCWCCT